MACSKDSTRRPEPEIQKRVGETMENENEMILKALSLRIKLRMTLIYSTKMMQIQMMRMELMMKMELYKRIL